MNTDTSDTLLQLEQRLIDRSEPFAVATVIRAGLLLLRMISRMSRLPRSSR